MRKALFIGLCALVGCESEGLDTTEKHPPQAYLMDDPIEKLELEDTTLGSGELVPVQRRDRRRMNIFQLNKALLDLTGYDYVQLLDAKGPLGQPDYREIIREVREPELFFQKFLQDAAHSNCDMLLDAEQQATSEERTFLKYIAPDDVSESAVRENLAYLLLLFHGHRYEENSDEVADWYTLFTKIQQVTADTQTSWKGVCVALIRHPDFYSY